MTNIEQKALALVQEVQGFECGVSIYHVHNAKLLRQALCRAIEQHEAFRQEVSDALKGQFIGGIPDKVARFIIPKPVDPLVEVMNEMGFGMSKTASEEFREALAKRGYEIREKAGDHSV